MKIDYNSKAMTVLRWMFFIPLSVICGLLGNLIFSLFLMLSHGYVSPNGFIDIFWYDLLKDLVFFGTMGFCVYKIAPKFKRGILFTYIITMLFISVLMVFIMFGEEQYTSFFRGLVETIILGVSLYKVDDVITMIEER